MQSNHFALIIAASEYDDTRLKRLRSPAADAHELEEVLRDQQIGNYEIASLLNPRAYQANEAIEDFFQDRRHSDQLLLYFSCHGIKDDRGRLYFAASNTKLNRLASTGVSSEFVAEQMYGCTARRIILMLDCCYSGAFKRGLRHRANESVDIDSLAGRGRAILFASSAMEYAFEIDSSEIEGTGISSLFTRTVVHALRTGEADLDGDGVVSVDELYDYVSDQLRVIMPRQTPGKLIDTEGTIFIARSTKTTSGFGVLPKDIRTALSSPLAGVRKGIVEELEPLLRSDHETERSAAKIALVQLSNDESDRVATAAAEALAMKTVSEGTDIGPLSDTLDEKAVLPAIGHVAPADHIASAHESTERSANFPSPAQASSPTEMADWIEKKQFSNTRELGYDEAGVDAFLDAVRDTFLGRKKPPVTAHDVRNVQFTSTSPGWIGYNEEEVDNFLDEVELVIESWTTTVSEDAAQEPSGLNDKAEIIESIKTAVARKLTEVFGKLSVRSGEVFAAHYGSPEEGVQIDATVRLPGKMPVRFGIEYADNSEDISTVIANSVISLARTVDIVSGHGALILVVPDDSADAEVIRWRDEGGKVISKYRSVSNIYVDKRSEFLALPAREFANRAMPTNLSVL